MRELIEIVNTKLNFKLKSKLNIDKLSIKLAALKKQKSLFIKLATLMALFVLANSGSAEDSKFGVLGFQNSLTYTTTVKHSKALTDAINFFGSLKLQSTRVAQLGEYSQGATLIQLRDALNLPAGAEINKEVLVNWLNKNVKEVHDESQSVRLERPSDGDTIPFTANENITMSNVSSISYYIVKAYNGYNFLVGDEVRNLPGPSEGILAIGPAFDQENSELTVLSTLFHEAKHSDCRALDSARDERDTEAKFAAALSLYKRNRGSEIPNCTYMHANCPKGHELEGYPACDGDKVGAYGTEALINEYMSVACANCSEEQKMQFQALFAENKSRVLGWERLFSSKVAEGNDAGKTGAAIDVNISSNNNKNNNNESTSPTDKPVAPHSSSWGPSGPGADGLTDRIDLNNPNAKSSRRMDLHSLKFLNSAVLDLIQFKLELPLGKTSDKLLGVLHDFLNVFEVLPTRKELHDLKSWERISKRRAKMAVDMASAIYKLKTTVRTLTTPLGTITGRDSVLAQRIHARAKSHCLNLTTVQGAPWPAYLGEICKMQL
jgi:hypothetical protein